MAGPQAKRFFTVKDMEKIVCVSAPTISSNGKEIAFTKYRVDKDTGIHIPRIFRVSSGGGEAIPLVENEEEIQDQPAFSSRGKKLAFLAPGRHEMQIWIVDLDKDQKLRKMTTLRHGVSKFFWAPDGKKIAFETKVWPGEDFEKHFFEMDAIEKEKWDWEQDNMPRITEELMYKFDETHGFVDVSIKKIGVLDLENEECKLIDTGNNPAQNPTWSNCSNLIAFYNYIYSHHKARRKEIFVFDLKQGIMKQITKETKYIGDSPPLFTPGDDGVIYSTYLEDDKGPVLKLVKTDLAGGEIINLFPEEEEEEEVCHGVSDSWAGKTEYGAVNPAYQLKNEEIYFTSSWMGHTHIYSLTLNTPSRIKKVTKGEFSVRTFCISQNNKLVYTRGDLETMDEVYCLDLDGGEDKRLTWSNEWMDEVINSCPEEMWVESKDGKAKIHGWVVPPAEIEEGKKYPAVLYIHGGPQISWTSGFWHEFQALAAAGIAVVYCDPRGSAGYGEGFVKNEYAWGDEPIEDLMAYLEAALANYPFLDGESLGITGGSYGGYMTVKMVGKLEGYFKAAVGQRILCNPATSYGTGDMGFISATKEKPESFKKYIMHRAERSLLTRIDRMKTPFLILHGMDDYRCSVEQAEQLFVAMKDRNPEIPVRMVLFPGENHDLTRSGRNTSQMRHLDEMVQWFGKYLWEEEK